MSDVKNTGWIRYHICDRSGGGWKDDKWIFCSGLDEMGEDEIREHIFYTRETWAVYAEHVRIEYFLGEIPPRGVLEAKLVALHNDKVWIDQQIGEIQSQLAEVQK